MKRVFTVAFVLALLCAAHSMADVPQLLSYQGVLTDGGGVAVPDNSYSITFRIYDVESGGSALWTEMDNVQVTKGVFSAVLGTQTALLNLKFDVTYYIGLSVGGGAELPRQILTASPYSLNSQAVIGSANVFPSSGNVGIGTTTPGSPLEVKFDNSDAAKPAIAIDNSAVGGQDIIDFMHSGVAASRIRHPAGGSLFLSTLTNSDIRFETNNVLRGAITNAGNMGIGTITPADKLEVTGGVKIGTTSNTNAGTIRWTGSDFEGYDGTTWKSFTATGEGPPSGTAGQTLRNDGTNWVATSSLYNDGTKVGIGTTTPTNPLNVVTGDICGIRIDGTAAGAWALMRINASGSGSNPGIELFRGGSSKSTMYVGAGDDWHLNMTGTDALTVDGVTRNLGIGVAAPAEKLDVAGALHLGTTSGTNAGTMRWTGTDFEGYDGTTWKSLTATGGGPPAGTTGQTLWYNGANWAATSNLFNDGTNIGIGTTAPGANLHVGGSGLKEVRVETSSNDMNAALELKTGNGIYDYLRLAKYGTTASGNINGIPLANLGLINTGATGGPMMLDVMTTNPMYFLTSNVERMRLTSDGRLGINTTAPGALLHVAGDAMIGTPTVDGSLQIYRNGSANPVVSSLINNYGGHWRTYDEANNITVSLEPDYNGEGGYLFVAKDAATEAAFVVDGNAGGSREPLVVITGDVQSADFDMRASGDASVNLPADAISSAEILDEPGVASYGNGTVGQGLSGTTTPVAGQSIVTPGAGYVLVIGTINLRITHTNGVASHGVMGVSTSMTTFPSNQDVYIDLPSGAASGIYYLPATFHGLFQVGSAGTYTYYLIGNATSGAYATFESQLSLIYLPTAYGSVVPTLASAQGASSGDKLTMSAAAPVSANDVAAQKAASEAVNAARVQKELNDVKARLAKLEKEMTNK